ncbi:MAG TPA: hypothetical protein VIG78_06265 [Gemmatimonadaceae bacterium]|jgi:hypothetical protein
MSSPCILLEFNEISPTLLARFMDEGKLPNFRRLHNESEVYVTDAEEAAPNLEPWIQWITAHCGLSYNEHGIFHLGDGHKLDRPSVWDILSRAGKSVWVCGSMNLNYDKGINGAVLPDPWAIGVDPHPAEYEAYYKFVQRNVQEYTNDRVPLTRDDYIAFLRFMVSHGLSLATVRAIVAQLIREAGGRQRWRRATILDKLQWDVFRSYYKKHRPDFSTFFLNSTAHFQHMHWRNMDPSPFKVKPTEQEQAEFETAILYGYLEMDGIIGQCLSLAGRDATVILASGLSQQPCLLYEDIGGKTFYRARELDRVLSFLGLTGEYTSFPVMSEEFHVRFTDERDAIAAEQRLAAVLVDGRSAMKVVRDGTNVFSGVRIHEHLDKDAKLTIAGTSVEAPFFRHFYKPEGTKSGMHHPDGVFWIRTLERRHTVATESASLRCVAPTLLDLFGIDAPAWMSGTSLFRGVTAPTFAYSPRTERTLATPTSV